MHGYAELRNGEETMIRQRLFSVEGGPKNRFYIDSGASINNFYSKELLTGLVKFNRSLKIQNGDKQIHMLQIRSQQYLMLPISTCQFIIFDYLEDVIVVAAEYLKNGRSFYPGNDQMFKIDDDSPRLPPKNAELFYHHIARLLFTTKRARLDMQVCISFLYTRVKSPMDHYKDIYLDIDLLFVNKIQVFLMISRNLRFMYFKALIFKYNKYVQDRLQ